jgi:uncharacterized membrane protein YkvA (DUF1232 family)
MSPTRPTPNGYEAHFDDSRFWAALRRTARSLSSSALRRMLVLYYCLKDPNTPAFVKATIVGALGYYVFSIQTVAIPMLGMIYLDDAGIIAGTFASVARSIRPEHYAQADKALIATLRDSEEVPVPVTS